MAEEDSFDLTNELDESSFEDSSPMVVDAAITDSADSVENLSGVEAAPPTPPTAAQEDEFAVSKGKKLLDEFSIFDGMLLCALLFVTMASMTMVWALGDYGGIFELPWKTTGIVK